ncbi:MAG: zf-HC2 domain-containing protein [Acidobacteriota bacterium]|nr:zf-HC2 domain-containing protein [Acidobacteriota bacterium]
MNCPVTCEVVRTYLSDFMDEELPAGILADIHEHLGDCLSCADLYDTLLAAEGFYGAAQGREVPERHRHSLNRRLEDLVGGGRKG